MRLSRRAGVIVVAGLVAVTVAAYLIGRVEPPGDVALDFWEAVLGGDAAAAMHLVIPYPSMPDAPRNEKELLERARLALEQAGFSRPEVSVVGANEWKGLSSYALMSFAEGDRTVLFTMVLQDRGWRGHWKVDFEACLHELVANAQRRTDHLTAP